MNYSFKTPRNLKVRLNPQPFMRIITGDMDKELSVDEILNTVNTSDALTGIDAMFTLTLSLSWYWLLLCIAFYRNVGAIMFISIFVALSLLGTALAILPFNRLLSSIAIIIQLPYIICPKIIRLLIFVLLIFVFRSYNLLLYSVIAYIIRFFVDSLANVIIRAFTKNKYEFAYNDTEICAFRVFYSYANKDLLNNMNINSFYDFVKWYSDLISIGNKNIYSTEEDENFNEK